MPYLNGMKRPLVIAKSALSGSFTFAGLVESAMRLVDREMPLPAADGKTQTQSSRAEVAEKNPERRK
jgi:hypothetical protein